MARPLRIQFPGAVYHITSRGNRQDTILLSDSDRLTFLEILGKTVRRYNWICHAYCLMDNHYHLLIENPDANLSLGMRQLNGMFTQHSNRTHHKTGHVFQGRFKNRNDNLKMTTYSNSAGISFSTRCVPASVTTLRNGDGAFIMLQLGLRVAKIF